MGIQELLSWYQKKIGTYDKQQWEKKIEKRFLDGLTHIRTMKTKQPKTEFIDLDLVRGSSFPKAKPKHGFITVTRFALKRLAFLPVYSRWWIEQTSPKIFALLLILYTLQLLNICLYTHKTGTKDEQSKDVSSTEIIIPISMMIVLSIVHSQIISTHTDSEKVYNETRVRRSKIRRRRISYNKRNTETKSSTESSPETRNNDELIKKSARKSSVDLWKRSKTNLSTPTTVTFNLNEPERKHDKNDVKDDGFESFNGAAENNETEAEIEMETKQELSSGEQSDMESDVERTPSSKANRSDTSIPANDYLGVTTNSEECSYSSENDESDSWNELNNNDMSDYDLAPTAILNPPSYHSTDRVSCKIWENCDIKKAELSVFDISSAIITRVELIPETSDYFYGGIVLSLLLGMLSPLYRLSGSTVHLEDLLSIRIGNMSESLCSFMDAAFGNILWERTVLVISFLERIILASLFFFLLAVAERTFKQRFLYAKFFSHLTSSRRARKSDLPHFRLNKVRNIKTWLSVRSYLKRRGPQRSVDVIVSTAFIITLLLLSFISMELLKDSETLHSQFNFEAVLWCFGLGVFLLRFMTLGTKINRKNRNLSVLITEQINLYLKMEQKPNKKDQYMVANSVLKLAADLLKELENPFKISGLSANPYLYNITKVVILSALSGMLSEMLGFKVKLTKIHIK